MTENPKNEPFENLEELASKAGSNLSDGLGGNRIDYEVFCKQHGIRIIECQGKGNEGFYDWVSKDDTSEQPLRSREEAAYDAWIWSNESDAYANRPTGGTMTNPMPPDPLEPYGCPCCRCEPCRCDEPDLSKCPKCGGPADGGRDRGSTIKAMTETAAEQNRVHVEMHSTIQALNEENTQLAHRLWCIENPA